MKVGGEDESKKHFKTGNRFLASLL